MTAFVDTNVIIAAIVEDSEQTAPAVSVLNTTSDVYTSTLNLMELRTVLSKKKQFERSKVDQIERRVASRVTLTFPDASDIMDANRIQSETLLYPMDALVLAASNAVDAPLVSFDAELQAHGAIHPTEYTGQ